MRTGRLVTHAATASSGCTETSSLPPKPPPQAVGRMRTRDCVDAQHACRLLPVHVGRLRAGGDLDAIRPVADGHGVAGLRLDVGVLDEGGLEAALGVAAASACPAATSPHLRLPRVSTLSGDVRRAPAGAPGANAASMPDDGGSGCPRDRQLGIARRFPPPAACRPAPAPPRRGSARRPAPAPAGPSYCAKMPNEFSPGTSFGGEDRHQARGAAH